MNNIFQVQRPNPDDALLTSSSNDDLIREYLSWKQSYTKTAYQAYKVWVLRFQEFTNKPPEQLRYTDYSEFASSLRERHASCGIEFALNVVHNYLRFFAEQGRLRFPLYLARVPRGYARSHEAFTETEYQTLINHMRQKKPLPLRDIVMVMLLHDTGMRVGELINLEIEDMEEDLSAVIRTEKTVRNRRVFWNAGTDDMLQQYLVERINRGPANLNRDALFVSKNARNGKSLHTRDVERMLKRFLKEAGISRKLSPHSFRHSFVHRLARLSVPDAIIAQLVGHSTPGTIANYTKLSRPEFQEYAHKQLASFDNAPQTLAA
jgi:site-specific recombinase XerD